MIITIIDIISIMTGLVGMTVAVVAIWFSWRVESNNNELNQRFTETLATINEKSATTQAVVDNSVSRIVEAFIETRAERTSGAFLADSSDNQMTLEGQRLVQLEQQISELSLRLRLQSRAPSSVSIFSRYSGVVRGSYEDVNSFLDQLTSIPGLESESHGDMPDQGETGDIRFALTGSEEFRLYWVVNLASQVNVVLVELKLE